MTARRQPLPPAAGRYAADFVPAYHNSGPMPNNTYRTGAVGVQVDMSSYFIVTTLLTMAKLTHALEGCNSYASGVRLHPALIHGAACSALVKLGAPADVMRSSRGVINALAGNAPPQGTPVTRSMEERAIASIAELRDVLRDRQLLPPFHGLVSCVTYDYVKERRPLPWLSCGANNRIAPLAWGLVAIACASPPILLFNRQPSLMWFRLGHSLMVRWFGAGTATGVSQ
ncbi:MAG: hypothetical protein P3C10_01895 [Gemmatimonadota bacterium]|nr:hypothetical protein [Gemmatimonadota bacterium]